MDFAIKYHTPHFCCNQKQRRAAPSGGSDGWLLGSLDPGRVGQLEGEGQHLESLHVSAIASPNLRQGLSCRGEWYFKLVENESFIAAIRIYITLLLFVAALPAVLDLDHHFALLLVPHRLVRLPVPLRLSVPQIRITHTA
eukprot:2037283-Rhodomonas_salina.4